MRVEFLDIDDKVLGSAETVGDNVVFSDLGVEALVRETAVVMPGNPARQLIPEEGEVYLAALPFTFDSPYFRAVLTAADTYDDV